ncbi:hypothetical protein [Actinocorallia sp. A-T 12471]|uniref:hypothetical protein n=1 Tax=Actinocorallia sp. A-T 12471 TaxID=3089813 RepID=UPI0029CAFF17|nr:hypothetical protein [Actinocorallia sp. A-T 12471]MDX6743802.1 hypothetical protein [Actinocorallia sp. A-T 12471]
MHLLCDIDGVHIPFPTPDGQIPDGFHTHHVTPTGHAEPVKIWLNPTTGRLLLDLVARLPLTPLWCTSWRADAHPLIGTRLALPAWDYVDLPRLPLTTSHPNGYLWKRDTVAALHKEPLIWIDDDFTPADHTWAHNRTTSGTPTLLIQPNPHIGLTQADVTPIPLWTTRHTGDSAGFFGDLPAG